MSTQKTRIEKDFAAGFIRVTREFDAPLEMVWRAYSESQLLDQWWGPAPWRAETRSLDFRAGGHWLYAMVSPEGQRHWARMNYLAIAPHTSISIEDAFCDDDGNVNPAMPVAKGEIVFTPLAGGTRVEFRTTYASEADLRTVVRMGIEQGLSICLDQLEALLARKAG